MCGDFIVSRGPSRLLTMRLTAVTLDKLSSFIVPAFTLPESSPVPSRLNITTIGAANGKSKVECWQINAPFVQSSQAGTAGAVVAQLCETGATSYLLLPPHFDGGFHNAPVVQYFSPLSLSFSTSRIRFLRPTTRSPSSR